MPTPPQMRTTYGKLMFMLMDAQHYLASDLPASLIIPIKTVRRALEAAGATAILKDPKLSIATAQIRSPGPGIRREAVAAALKKRAATLTALCGMYATEALPAEELMNIIAAISDSHSYMREAVGPVSAIHGELVKRFGPDGSAHAQHKLNITSGSQGARLTHSHTQQITYCSQTFILWREILTNMYQLWSAAEDDMLDPRNRYSLRVTGQGPNRVQGAPRVGSIMGRILQVAYSKSPDAWFGSSAVHLGDENVPNALVFIDKYSQVERILAPIVRTIRDIDTLRNHPTVSKWLLHYYDEKQFSDISEAANHAQNRILVDFFRHGFDGSGADNFFSAGSCIDGRLTSAWNWCNKIASKTYYELFLVTGFNGFEGSFTQ